MASEKPDRIPAVAFAMTPFPWVIDASAPLSQAKAMMIEHRFGHLPVVESGVLTGVISERDIHIVEGSAGNQTRLDALTVLDAAVPNPYVVPIHQPLDEVLLEMSQRHAAAVIVVKDGRVAGIFTATDACRRFGEFLRVMFPEDESDDVA
jgi:acetoin utilization protein AcuB